MKSLRKPIYATAAYNTVSLGTGRKEFHPKKPRPGIEHYITEAGQGALAQINDAANIDEGVIANFMAPRFNRQGNLPALMPLIDASLEYKPLVRVEGACGSGGLGLTTAAKSILSDMADTVLTVGFEVQNTVKALRRGHSGRRGPLRVTEEVGPRVFLPREVLGQSRCGVREVRVRSCA